MFKILIKILIQKIIRIIKKIVKVTKKKVVGVEFKIFKTS